MENSSEIWERHSITKGITGALIAASATSSSAGPGTNSYNHDGNNEPYGGGGGDSGIAAIFLYLYLACVVAMGIAKLAKVGNWECESWLFIFGFGVAGAMLLAVAAPVAAVAIPGYIIYRLIR